jgi:hypothetical protein
VLLSGAVTCDFEGTDPVRVVESSEFDSQWNGAAKCSCASCNWTGTVADAAESEDELVPTTPLDEELINIERELEAGACPPQMEATVRALLEMVRSLKTQIQVADNVAGRPRTDEGDTAIY